MLLKLSPAHPSLFLLEIVLTGAEKSEIRTAFVPHLFFWCFPASNEFKDRLRRTKRIFRIVEWIVEYLDDQHQNEDKDESCVEVGHIESGPKTTNQSVTANNRGKKHCSKLWAEVSYQAVQDSCASDGEGHHHNQVGEEGKGAEHQVGAGSKSGLDHLEESFSTWCPGLEHDGQDGEDDDLDGGATGIPVGATDTILASDGGRLQEGG